MVLLTLSRAVRTLAIVTAWDIQAGIVGLHADNPDLDMELCALS